MIHELIERFQTWRESRGITQQKAALTLAAMDYAALLHYQDTEPELAALIRELAAAGMDRRAIVVVVNGSEFAPLMGGELRAAIRAAVRESRGR